MSQVYDGSSDIVIMRQIQHARPAGRTYTGVEGRLHYLVNLPTDRTITSYSLPSSMAYSNTEGASISATAGGDDSNAAWMNCSVAATVHKRNVYHVFVLSADATAQRTHRAMLPGTNENAALSLAIA